jgi:hypothetical protein
MDPPNMQHFALNVEDLTEICNFDKRLEKSQLSKLKDLGGIDGVANLLKSK